MSVTGQTVLAKRHEGPGTIATGTAYPEVVAIMERMARQDPKVIFDSLRPIGEEFWNMIDERRTVAEIAEAVCLEFGFDLDPELFIPFVEGAEKAGAVGIVDR